MGRCTTAARRRHSPRKHGTRAGGTQFGVGCASRYGARAAKRLRVQEAPSEGGTAAVSRHTKTIRACSEALHRSAGGRGNLCFCERSQRSDGRVPAVFVKSGEGLKRGAVWNHNSREARDGESAVQLRVCVGEHSLRHGRWRCVGRRWAERGATGRRQGCRRGEDGPGEVEGWGGLGGRSVERTAFGYVGVVDVAGRVKEVVQEAAIGSKHGGVVGGVVGLVVFEAAVIHPRCRLHHPRI
mmetsp:Transcript_24250/g.41729  ORF Transcript_24250/g.41729 Transcript_24250/m.41729 type:complete len:240 (-) Transcript_24250:137-856(-)